MRNIINTRILTPLAAACLLLFSSCMKDKITRTYQIYEPIYKTLAEVRTQIKSGPATEVTAAGKMTVFGNYIFLTEVGTGIHVIDNTDAAHPKNISFINIPGIEDIAIRGSVLYADAYADLVSFDISNPAAAVAMNFVTNVFPDHTNYIAANNPDGFQAVVGWTVKDTTVSYDPSLNYIPVQYSGGCASCETLAIAPTASSSSKAPTGTNGSTARFSIIGSYLYTVGYSSLTTFDISNAFTPQSTSTVQVDWHVETIYPFKNQLFVGTNNGVYMFDVVASPAQPEKKGEFTHVRGCDPVVADDNYAYVTINDSNACLGFNNELQIVDIHNLDSSFLVDSYQLTHPIGLSKDGNLLFVCDGSDGLKIYDATDVNNLRLLAQLKDQEAYDVIAQDGKAIVLGKQGIFQYDYTNLTNVQLISKF